MLWDKGIYTIGQLTSLTEYSLNNFFGEDVTAEVIEKLKGYDLKLNQKRVLREDVPIGELDMSPRAINALNKSGILTVGSLITYSKDDLRRVRNLGDRSIKEIEHILEERGMKLSNKPNPRYNFQRSAPY